MLCYKTFRILYSLATAGMGFALVLLLALALTGLWVLHKRRMRKRQQKMLTWEPKYWHHNDCEKVQPTKVCNCPKTDGVKAPDAIMVCTCGTAGGPCRVHNPTVYSR